MGARRRICRGIGLALLVVALSACGDDDSASTSGADDEVDGTSEEVVGVITESSCAEGSSCAAGFRLEGELFVLSCGAVRPDAVTDRVAGRGEIHGASIEARRLAGVEEDVALAVDRPGGGCAEGQEPTTDWSFAFAEAAEQAATDAAICAAGLAPDPTPAEC